MRLPAATVFALPATAAYSEYGTGVICWRGGNVRNAAPALVWIAISSQLLAPVKAAGPKSTAVVKKPLVKTTAPLVTGPASTVPPVLLS